VSRKVELAAFAALIIPQRHTRGLSHGGALGIADRSLRTEIVSSLPQRISPASSLPRDPLTSQPSGSFVSAILSAMGYLSFAAILSAAEPGTPMLHLYLTASYFCVGAATVGSYFACLTCGASSPPHDLI
jgi:hypothetical protein